MNLMRQSGIVPLSIQSLPVTVVGTGGIGAAAAVALAKLGVGRLVLYDPDHVEDVNIPTQLLRLSDIGKPKVASVAALIKELTDVTGVGYVRRVTAETRFDTPIVISALDSIEARKQVWQAVKNSAVMHYLDARMAAEVFHLYTVKIREHEWYEEFLNAQTDDDVPEDPCTARATIYTAFIAAGMIAAQLKRIISEDKYPKVQVFDIKNLDLLIPMW